MFSGPSVERLHICDEGASGLGTPRRIAHGFWKDLPSLRELSVRLFHVPLNKLTAPNLTHLALEEVGANWQIKIENILGALRGCPLLETFFLSSFGVCGGPTRDHSPVSLPHLRDIEVGGDEVHSGLTTYLLFPQNVAVGFRLQSRYDVLYSGPLANMVATDHALGRIDIRCITLAIGSTDPLDDIGLLVRFEGLCGSLEITYALDIDATVRDVFFGSSGMLFSKHASHMENVRELHIVGNVFGGGQGLHHVHAAMPNLVSVSFFSYEGPQAFTLLTPTDPSLPPFPHLERIMILGPEQGLREMVKTRSDYGVPLKTLVIGRGSGQSEYDYEEDRAALGEFVDDLRIGCPTKIVEWGTENEVLNIWSTTEIPGPVSLNRKPKELG